MSSSTDATCSAQSTATQSNSTQSTAKPIARVAIHPGIGIARVGNSREPDSYFIGPEVTNPESYYIPPDPLPSNGLMTTERISYKDGKGAIKRQAARFRIYAYDEDGQVIREVTADDSNTEIIWTVEIANKKASWYEFIEALDLEGAPPAAQRNANIQPPPHDDDPNNNPRRKLEIRPNPQTISGQSQPARRFDDGRFMDAPLPVYLGELRTDSKGRLLFLGGYGESKSGYPNNPPASFGNNNGWHDDTSDGPVNATVIINGQRFEADEAWVVTAPPNYGTSLIGVKTMYDVMEDMFINPSSRALWRPFPKDIYFTQHILPILQQFSDAQWVNYGFAVQYGYDGPFDFTRKEFLEKLARIIPLSKEEQAEQTKPEEELVLKKDVYQEFRRQIFNQFRKTDNNDPVIQQWPWMYGDTVQLGDAPEDANQYLSMTETQLQVLEKWVEGKFIDDLKIPNDARTHVDIAELYPNTYPTIEQYPIGKQPAELDRAAMHFCLGGAFHPGCEMTWPMRNSTMYRAPFRIRRRSRNNPEPDYGPVLTHDVVIDENGPLYFNAPGDITRWMAVPWQTDTSSCRSGYEPDYDPFLPTFWPARVPNHVLTEENYEIVMNRDGKYSQEERLAAFNNRAVWLRGLPGEYRDQIREMVTMFGKLGILEKRPGPRDDPNFPDVIYVETEVGYPEPESPLANLLFQYIPAPSEARYWRNRRQQLGG